MADNSYRGDLERSHRAWQQAQDLRTDAAAAKIRALGLSAWTRAVYSASQYRLGSDADHNGHALDQAEIRQRASRLLWQILNAAIAVSHADYGNVQIVHPVTGHLQIVAQQGFEPPFLDYFNAVPPGTAACGAALHARHRIIITNVAQAPEFSSAARKVVLDAGVRAVQSTPVLDNSGAVIGIISTHFQRPHQPSNASLRLIETLARGVGTALLTAGVTSQSSSI